jgi:hypothetical protein
LGWANFNAVVIIGGPIIQRGTTGWVNFTVVAEVIVHFKTPNRLFVIVKPTHYAEPSKTDEIFVANMT